MSGLKQGREYLPLLQVHQVVVPFSRVNSSSPTSWLSVLVRRLVRRLVHRLCSRPDPVCVLVPGSFIIVGAWQHPWQPYTWLRVMNAVRWLSLLSHPCSFFNVGLGLCTFGPGVKSRWKRLTRMFGENALSKCGVGNAKKERH